MDHQNIIKLWHDAHRYFLQGDVTFDETMRELEKIISLHKITQESHAKTILYMAHFRWQSSSANKKIIFDLIQQIIRFLSQEKEVVDAVALEHHNSMTERP